MSEPKSLTEPLKESMNRALQVPATFDSEIYHIMEKRDEALISDEILHGSVSAIFVYNFPMGSLGEGNKNVSGISVRGAAHLARHYGGLKHRIVASSDNRGAFMNSFAPIPTENKEWGFWGTNVGNGYDAELTWDTASRFLHEHFDLTPEQACKVLDNRFGRHLADDLSFIEGGPATAEAIANHLARRINHDGWRKFFEDVIRAETGKTYPSRKPLSKEDLFANIAREHLNIETLEERKSDSLDFHDVGVVGIRRALGAAYEAGRALKK